MIKQLRCKILIKYTLTGFRKLTVEQIRASKLCFYRILRSFVYRLNVILDLSVESEIFFQNSVKWGYNDCA